MKTLIISIVCLCAGLITGIFIENEVNKPLKSDYQLKVGLKQSNSEVTLLDGTRVVGCCRLDSIGSLIVNDNQ